MQLMSRVFLLEMSFEFTEDGSQAFSLEDSIYLQDFSTTASYGPPIIEVMH